MSMSWEGFLAFLTAVDQMRECQKAYFRTRSPSSLAAAKKCERAVDAIIKQARAEKAREIQTELFGGEQ